MFYEVGYEVERLVRTRIGHLRLGDMPRGHWRPLTKSELALLGGSGATTPPRAGSREAASSRPRNS
jgi:16S rRNA U516 pseudouridylate synthase RsuA-like enzyme